MCISFIIYFGLSLSARRAWIEIRTVKAGTVARVKVALRKESVDRNYWMNRRD